MKIHKNLFITLIIFCLPLNSAFSQSDASSNPSYRDGILTVPRVDTDEQPGAFQNAVFIFNPTANNWLLQSYEAIPIPSIFVLSDDGVEVIVTNETPVQVFLKVKGSFGDGCYEPGKVDQRLQGNHFEIVLHVDSTIPRDGTVTCAAMVEAFEKIIPLQVYGLTAGSYEYRVNGEKTGTIVLEQDNHL